MWLVFAVARFAGINRWKKASAFVAIGTAASAGCNALANYYIYKRLLMIGDIITILACTTVAVLLFLIGIGRIRSADTPEPEKRDELSELLLKK
jgi:hypothetical protein